MEHPENNEEYKGLTVNSGVEQPSIVNPYLKRGRFRRREMTVAEMVDGIVKGDVTILSQAVTLVESVNPAHQQKAQEVIEKRCWQEHEHRPVWHSCSRTYRRKTCSSCY